MMKNTSRTKVLVAIGIIAIACFSRLIPHPLNFTPLGAIALFGAVHFKNKLYAVGLPLLCLLVSNLLINSLIYGIGGLAIIGNLWVYLGFVGISFLGLFVFGKISIPRIFGASLGASAVFFLLSNFGSWLSMAIYPKTAAGLLMAYEAGLPYFWNTLAGDLFYCSVLFGSYYLLSLRIPGLKKVKV